MNGRRIYLALTTALIAALLLIACGQHGSRILSNIINHQAHPQQQDDSVNNVPLPGVFELDGRIKVNREVSADGTITSQGLQAYIDGQTGTNGTSGLNVEQDGTFLTLRAFAPGEYAYGIYGQTVGAAPKPLKTLINSEVCKIGGGRDEEIPLSYFIGIADYTEGAWRWFGPFGAVDVMVTVNSETLKSRFKSPSDNCYLCVLASNGSKAASALPDDGSTVFPIDLSARSVSAEGDDPGGLTIEQVVTWVEEGLLTEPAMVTGLSAVVGGSSITLSWDASPDTDVTSYEIYRKEVGIEGPPALLDSVAAPATGYDDMTAAAGMTYLYGVRAVNNVGPGGIGYVTVGPPIVSWVSPTLGSAGASVKFIAIVSGSEPFTYAWDFGGGAAPNTSTEDTPAVTLGTINTYSATLTVTNAYGNDTYPFTLTVIQPTYSVSGTVTKSTGGGLQGATLTLTPGNRSATTNSSGAYTITAVSNGSYTLTPSLSGWSFSPTSHSVSVSSGDVTGKNFTASEVVPSEWHIAALDIAVGWESVPGCSFGIVNGNPAVSYRDSTDGFLKYVRASNASGSSWGTPVIVEDQTWECEHLSLAVVNGNPAMSYYDANNNNLKYVRASDANGSAWGSPVTIDSEGVPIWDTCLLVVNGQPAISYWDDTNNRLKYVRASDAQGSSWGSPITVGSAGADGGKGSNSLVVVNGNPAIMCLYSKGTNYEEDIIYVRANDANGDTWGTPVTVDSTSDNDMGPSLAVVNGYPAISYYDFTNHYLKYVQATDASGGSWGTPVTVDSEGETHYFSSLATVNGNPAISYSTLNMDWTNADLKYVRATDASGSSWGTPVTVDSAGDVGYGASLVVADIYPAIFYYDRTNGDMKYAYFGP